MRYLINVILISHGQLAAGSLDAAVLIIGKQDGVKTLALTEEDPIEGLTTRLEDALAEMLPGSQGVLILVDLFGASPFNVAAMATQSRENVEVVSGLNLPMLVEVLMQREFLSLKELSDLAEKSGIEGVKVLSNVMPK